MTAVDNKDFRLGNNKQITGTIKAANLTAFVAGEALALDTDGTYIKWSKTAGKIAGFCARAFTMGVAGTSANEYIVVGGSIDSAAITLPAGVTIDTVVGDTVREEQIPFIHLTAGVDITTRPFFSKIVASVIKAVSILTKGTPTGIDDSNTCVIAITNEAAASIVSKTYNTGTQPPTKDYASLGAVTDANCDIAAGGIANIAVTQGSTADLPEFDLVVQYLLKDTTPRAMLTAAGFDVYTVAQNTY